MVISSTGKDTCCIDSDNFTVEQVTQYKYLGSWITEDAGCEVDIRARIGMTKEDFWKNKEPMRRDVKFHTKLKILDWYVFSVLSYGCESWTWNMAMKKKLDAFEMWCYRRILKISWKDGVKNEDVLKRVRKLNKEKTVLKTEGKVKWWRLL